MAKYENQFQGNIKEFVKGLDEEIINGSASASLEDESEYTIDSGCVVIKVYERFSVVGSNRVSLSVTLVEQNNLIHLTAITAGGSQAIFFKVNTFGEDAFLSKLVKYVEGYIGK